MERKIKDESFVSRALSLATTDDGRAIANQSEFDGLLAEKLPARAHAALVTAVAIYHARGELTDEHVARALAVVTVGEARALVDEVKPIVDTA